MWFSNMGSKQIWNLGYRQPFIFMGLYNKKACFESSSQILEEKIKENRIYHFNDVVLQKQNYLLDNLDFESIIKN